MLESVFFFVQDGVGFKVSIGVFVSTGNNFIDVFNQWSISFSELEFEFVGFSGHLEFDSSFLQNVMIDGDGLYFILEGGDELDFVFDLLFECELNRVKKYLLLFGLNV